MGSAICGPLMREHSRKPWEVRYCYNCRKKTMHQAVVLVEVEPGWYGPHKKVECQSCGKDCTRMNGEPVRFAEA